MTALSEYPISLPDGRSMRVAVCVPEADRPVPGVVVIHEVLGLTDFIREVCLRFAAEGYAAIAPDLLSTGTRLGCLIRLMRDLRRRDLRTGTNEMLETARQHLVRQPGVDPDRTGVIGFCLGGGFALIYGVTSDVRASTVNYGQVPDDGSLLAGSCPVVASFGGRDGTLRGAAERLEGHLTALGIPHDVRSYPEAGHGFLTDYTVPGWLAWLAAPFARAMHTGYQPEAAADTWRRVFTFFDEYVRSA